MVNFTKAILFCAERASYLRAVAANVARYRATHFALSVDAGVGFDIAGINARRAFDSMLRVVSATDW